ncbi:MAG TPA: glutamate-5-semialdehyde dehydrogenase, partial [Acidimicrobiia bacterium]
MSTPLTGLTPGMPIVYGGDRVVTVGQDLAEAFRPGDRLVVVQDSGDLLHIPAAEWERASGAVDAAVGAFTRMGSVTRDQLATFFSMFASRLEDDEVFAPIRAANDRDVASARERGRSTTRLLLTDRMRRDMVEGLRMWADADVGRGEVIDSVAHDGWTIEQVRSGLGAVGFIFEGRPNVFADATGVLAGGNTVVFRIGS